MCYVHAYSLRYPWKMLIYKPESPRSMTAMVLYAATFETQIGLSILFIIVEFKNSTGCWKPWLHCLILAGRLHVSICIYYAVQNQSFLLQKA